jgi:hypothetical protein
VETNEIVTDKRLIFRDIYLEMYKRLTISQSDATIYNEREKELLSANFYSTNKKTITYRKYIKIPEIIASVGGIFKFISLFFEYLNRPFNFLIWNSEIIESLFEKQSIGKLEEKQNNNSNKIVSSANFINPEGFNKIFLHNLKPKSKNINDSSICRKNEEPFNSKIKLKINFCNKIKLLVFPCLMQYSSRNEEINLYQNGCRKINNIFDLLSICKKIIEFENFEKLFLSEAQITLIQSIRSKLSSNFEVGNYPDSETEEKLQKNFILNFNPISELDKKIYELLH